MNLLRKAASLLDDLVESPGGPARTLERIAVVFLLIMAAAAPHSIAATQTAWIIGMLVWVARMCVKPRPRLRVTAPGVALFALFLWTALSSAFSYEPAVSLDKLRGAAVFLIFFLVLNTARNRRLIFVTASLMIASAMISVAWTPVEKLIGRGVQLHGVEAGGPLDRIGFKDGDVVMRVNGVRVSTPEDIIARLSSERASQLELNRLDGVFRRDFPPIDRSATMQPEERLGFGSWNRFRGFRADGFYGHFTTYAEVLQLLAALVLGLLVSLFLAAAGSRAWITFGVAFAAMGAALLLTVTRASQLALAISSTVIVFLGGSKRLIATALLIAIPVGIIGVSYLRSQRQVGFIDRSDASIQYREMMWRDGLRLLSESPRHLIVGVGIDSIKDHWEEWGLYDTGHQPMGHFHSTPIQLAVERGIPALLIWIAVLALLARSLWRSMKLSRDDPRSRGVALGALGSLIGFFASGLVHYNLGDQEVAMVFYIIMGLGVGIAAGPRPEDLLLVDSPLLEGVLQPVDEADTA